LRRRLRRVDPPLAQAARTQPRPLCGASAAPDRRDRRHRRPRSALDGRRARGASRGTRRGTTCGLSATIDNALDASELLVAVRPPNPTRPMIALLQDASLRVATALQGAATSTESPHVSGLDSTV